ncbi:hypothetical protein CsSME_00009184 [Camellia sinensis var. sinensis]
MPIKETPERFPLPTKATMVKAATGWAHCVSVTDLDPGVRITSVAAGSRQTLTAGKKLISLTALALNLYEDFFEKVRAFNPPMPFLRLLHY